MITLLIGREAKIKYLPKRAATFRLEAENFSQSAWQEAVASQSLFGEVKLVVVDYVSEIKGSEDIIKKSLKEIAKSPDGYYFIEPGEKTAVAKLVKPLADKVKTVEEKVVTKDPTYNVFGLTDKLLTRDRQKLWLAYQEALASGLQAEEMFWPLWWQVKNLLLVKTAGPKDKLPLKPFVLSKAKSGAAKFTLRELDQLAQDLITLYQDAKIDRANFTLGLEKIILNL